MGDSAMTIEAETRALHQPTLGSHGIEVTTNAVGLDDLLGKGVGVDLRRDLISGVEIDMLDAFYEFHPPFSGKIMGRVAIIAHGDAPVGRMVRSPWMNAG